MNSPRSLEACRQLGILPEELFFQDFETYIKLNPEVIGLPKDIQKIRFDNIDNYRKETINMVKEQRMLIINKEKDNTKEKEKMNQTQRNPSMNNNNFMSNYNSNNELNSSADDKLAFNLDEQLNSILLL